MLRRLCVGVLLGLLLLVPVAVGASGSEAERQAGLADVALDLPTLPPMDPWSYALPGWRRSYPEPGADVKADLAEAIKRLERGWPTAGHGDDLVQCCAGVLHLSPPGAPPRAILWLSDQHLWQVERRGESWHTERLTSPWVQHVSVQDLTGDGHPEIVAANQGGSGGVLVLQIFTWDQRSVWRAFVHEGAREPGLFGFYDAEGDGVSELWIDSASTKGLFTDEPRAHEPFLRDRFTFRWQNGTYGETARYRYATPFYHLNRYLLLASRGERGKAARHLEEGARIEEAIRARLGTGPFREGGDSGFVNGRVFFAKGEERFFADFGPTGRLLRIGEAEATVVPSGERVYPPGWGQAFSVAGRSAHWRAESLFTPADFDGDGLGFEFDTTLIWQGGPARTGRGFTHGRCIIYPWDRPSAELSQAVSQGLYLVAWEDEDGVHAEALHLEPFASSIRPTYSRTEEGAKAYHAADRTDRLRRGGQIDTGTAAESAPWYRGHPSGRALLEARLDRNPPGGVAGDPGGAGPAAPLDH